ncbi:MAG TPA: M20/M25/M40 family metallo-hydrolase [Solirubrobacterales bacterium]|nr:M20/M25/M40 family metallo-hydrolase [Solirubrobacterales bacterium]
MEGNQRLFDTFVRLCEIRSPTGEEREIADTLAAELRALGLEVEEDDAAGPAEAGAGNLLARLPGAGEEWVMFCAHIDTVPHKGRVEVVDDEGVFRSRGETILGADNKAAVAVFMELVARATERKSEVGIELLLTVAEEQGLRGAKVFDTSKLRAPVGFVLDHAGPVGEVIVQTPTQQKIRADFHGVEAHAGIRPEDGNSAIAAAAAAISRMELGRLDEGTTANVGLISGGTSGNVVPGHCWIHAETRSLDPERAAEIAGKMSDACAWGASEHGCDVDVRLEELFRGYELPKDSPALGFAEAGLRGAGLEPARVAIGGGSDVNAFRRAGHDSVLLSNGTDMVHTEHEFVPAANLVKMLEVCEGIVAAAANGASAPDGAASEA